VIDAPAFTPDSYEADGAGPRGSVKHATRTPYVRVVNPVWNGSGYIKRKKAEHYVRTGRGCFVALDQLRLNESHPDNIAAASRAAAGYEGVDRLMTVDELAHLPMARPQVAYTSPKGDGRRRYAGRSGTVRLLTSREHSR